MVESTNALSQRLSGLLSLLMIASHLTYVASTDGTTRRITPSEYRYSLRWLFETLGAARRSDVNLTSFTTLSAMELKTLLRCVRATFVRFQHVLRDIRASTHTVRSQYVHEYCTCCTYCTVCTYMLCILHIHAYARTYTHTYLSHT